MSSAACRGHFHASLDFRLLLMSSERNACYLDWDIWMKSYLYSESVKIRRHKVRGLWAYVCFRKKDFLRVWRVSSQIKDTFYEACVVGESTPMSCWRDQQVLWHMKQSNSSTFTLANVSVWPLTARTTGHHVDQSADSEGVRWETPTTA